MYVCVCVCEGWWCGVCGGGALGFNEHVQHGVHNTTFFPMGATIGSTRAEPLTSIEAVVLRVMNSVRCTPGVRVISMKPRSSVLA